MSGKPTSLLLANLTCMASMFVWAAGLPAADVIIPLLPEGALSGSLAFSASRMVLGALALLPIWAMMEGFGALRRAQWLRGIAVGSLIGIGALCVVVGQTLTDPVTVAIISATMPLVGIAMEVMWDGKRLTLGLVLGLILSMAGSVVALGGGVGGLSLGLGAAICFLSVITFTLGSRLTVTAFPTQSAIGRTAITLTGAAVATSIACGASAALGGVMPDPARFGLYELAMLAIFAIGGLAISQVLWIISVGNLGIGLSSLHINATPFYVMLILYAFGAPWNHTQALGALIVGFGVLIAQGLIPLPRRTPQP